MVGPTIPQKPAIVCGSGSSVNVIGPTCMPPVMAQDLCRAHEHINIHVHAPTFEYKHVRIMGKAFETRAL